MKMYINGSIKEFNGIKITATELIIQLNLNGKRFAIEKNGEIISKNFHFVHPTRFHYFEFPILLPLYCDRYITLTANLAI